MAELEPWIEKLIQNYGQSQRETTVKANVVGVSSSSRCVWSSMTISVVCEYWSVCVLGVWYLRLAADGAHRCLYAVHVRWERCHSRGAERRRVGEYAGVRDLLILCYDTTHYTPEPLFLSNSSG